MTVDCGAVNFPKRLLLAARMKAQHRHELQTNELAEWLEAKIEQIKPYTQAIIGALIAAVVLAGVWMYLRHMDSSAEQAASDSLVAAINNPADPLKLYQETLDAHPGTPQAVVARLLMGQQLLRTGSDQLYTNKLEARKNLAAAASEFSEVEASADDQMIRAWALYALGLAHESLGELDRAREDFEKLKKEYPTSSRVGDAEQHLADLDKRSTKEFYDWFAKQDPRPLDLGREPGKPGQKPIFDLSDPTAVPKGDLKLPSALDGSSAPSTKPPASVPPATTETTSPAVPSGEAASSSLSNPPVGSSPEAEKLPATNPSAPESPAEQGK
ncbi:MAG: tetratricopeptide repeat protein [Pirellulales bacterium]|nr:tetratricopeptide repeat protein [Pirellulales bacterium]